jgi:hypothetical protein
MKGTKLVIQTEGAWGTVGLTERDNDQILNCCVDDHFLRAELEFWVKVGPDV